MCIYKYVSERRLKLD